MKNHNKLIWSFCLYYAVYRHFRVKFTLIYIGRNSREKERHTPSRIRFAVPLLILPRFAQSDTAPRPWPRSARGRFHSPKRGKNKFFLSLFAHSILPLGRSFYRRVASPPCLPHSVRALRSGHTPYRLGEGSSDPYPFRTEWAAAPFF